MGLDYLPEFFETSPIVHKIKKRFASFSQSESLKSTAAIYAERYMAAAIFVVFLILSISILNNYFADTTQMLYYYTAPEGQGILPNGLIGYLIPRIEDGMIVSSIFKIVYVLLGFIISVSAAGIIKHCAKNGRQQLVGFAAAVFFLAFLLKNNLCVDDFAFNAAIAFALTSVAANFLIRGKMLFLVPVICCAAALADVRFVFTLFPLIAVIFFSRIFVRPAENKKTVCALFAVTAVIAALSLPFHFYIGKTMGYTSESTEFMTNFISANEIPRTSVKKFDDATLSNYFYELFHTVNPADVPAKLPVNLINAALIYASFYMADKLKKRFGSKASVLYNTLIIAAFVFVLAFAIAFDTDFTVSLIRVLCSAFAIVFLYSNDSSVREHYDYLRSVLKRLLVCWFIVAAVKYIVDSCMGAIAFSRAPYFLDYFQFGFVQRGLIGTLFYLVLGNDLSEVRFHVSTITMYIICALLIVFIIVKMARKKKNTETGRILAFLAGLYVLSPTFSSHFDSSSNLRIDIYYYVLSFLCVYILYKNNNLVLVVPLICACCMLIHQIFAALLFPMIFIIFTYRCFVDSQGHTPRNICAYSASILIVCALFVYFMFFAMGNTIITLDRAYDLVELKSGGFYSPDKDFFEGVIFSDMSSHAEKFKDMITTDQRLRVVKFYLIISPLWVMYIYAFRKTLRTTEGRFAKLAVTASALTVLAVIPCYIIETDYGRWNCAALNTMIMSIFMFTLMQDDDKKWYRELRRSDLTAWMFLIGIILTSMEKFDCWYG